MGHPQAHLFMPVAMEIRDGVVDPRECFHLAVVVLEEVRKEGRCGGWGRGWAEERLRVCVCSLVLLPKLSVMLSSYGIWRPLRGVYLVYRVVWKRCWIRIGLM